MIWYFFIIYIYPINYKFNYYEKDVDSINCDCRDRLDRDKFGNESYNEQDKPAHAAECRGFSGGRVRRRPFPLHGRGRNVLLPWRTLLWNFTYLKVL